MITPSLTLETATALLSLANANVWHIDHASGQLLATPDTLALWLDAPPGPTQLSLAELQTLVHPSDWLALLALWSAAASDSPQSTTVRLYNRHGAWRWLKLRTQVVARTDQNLPTRSMGLVTDISTPMRHRTHLQLQQAFAEVMADNPDRDTLARAMLSAALTLPDLNRCGLYLRDADGGYTLLASESLSPVFLAAVGRLWPDSLPAQLANAGRLVVSFLDAPLTHRPNDPSAQHPTEHSGHWAYEPAMLQRPAVRAEGIQSLVLLPIRVDGAVCACLNLGSTQARRLSDATVAFLQTLASQFGLALERLAAREEAQHQRENIEGFFQTLQDYVTVLDEQGNIQYISDSVRQQLGYGDALLGQHVLAMHPPHVHTQAMEVVQAMVAGERDSCPLPILTVDGRELMVDTRIVRGHWNGQPALLAVSRDVTELMELQRQLELRTRYQQATMDNFPFLVWLKDPQGRFLAVNQPFAQACGRPDPQSVIGLTVHDVWPADLAQAYEADDRAALASGQSRQTEKLIETQGLRHWSEIYRSPVFMNGHVLGTVGCARDITQRKQAEIEREEAEVERNEVLARLQSIAEQLPGVIYQYHRRADGTTHFPYASGAMWEIFGVTPESAQCDSSLVLAAIHPDDRARVVQTLQTSLQTLTLWKQDYRVLRAEHTSAPPLVERWVQAQASPQRLPDGSTLWHGYTHDVTEERRANERMRLGASVLAHSYDGIMVTDAHNTIIEVNPAFSRITGYEPSEVLGRTPSVLSSGQHGPEFYAALWASLERQGHWNGEIWNRRKNGEVYPETLSIAAMTNEVGLLTHYIGVFSDITRLKNHEAQLAHIAHYDELTGLPNRRLLSDRMRVALARARRDEQPLAICMLDLDGFKAINDSHGHAAGDDLLEEVGRRLQRTVREDDTVARLGGDEFVLLLSDLQHPEESHNTLERVLQAIAQPIALSGVTVQVSVSMGMTRYPHDDADADTLLRHADQAMYAAKQAGKNRYHLFDPELDRQIQAHREKLARLKQAMLTGELVMHYQPKVNLRTGAIIGMEALIRWQHPTEGLLPPSDFLPLVIGHAFEHQLGDWVIEQVLMQSVQWQALGLDWVVSANISPSHLLNGQFSQNLARALAAHPQVIPQRLELEILETAAIGDMECASQVLHRCRTLGVRFALDDFGTGYSSLSYFRNLPVDMIKIDQSFVRDMLDDPNDLSIVDSVLRLAQAFNRPVIAEGVETLQHGSALLQLGCELAQGYGVARPMSAESVPEWMAQWQAQAVWKTLSHPHSGRDLTLLAVTRSHRNWLASVLRVLDEGRDHFGAELNLNTCTLGRWLAGSGAATYGDSPQFSPVCQLHDRAHALANQLLFSIKNPQAQELDRLNRDLQTTSTKLLECLEQLIQPKA